MGEDLHLPAIEHARHTSEYRPQAGGLLRDAPSKGALETSFLIRFFLFADILLHTRQFEPHGGHRRAACPAYTGSESLAVHMVQNWYAVSASIAAVSL